jgi:rhodanese-related sulfurtransferase
MRSLAASLLCVLALNTGCSQDLTWKAVDHMIASDFPEASFITTDSLAERLSDPTAPRPTLLDARSPDEYAVSHLPGARRVDPTATTFPDLDTLSRDTPIVVYCSVGYRSARVTTRLQEQGFTNVRNLRGSIFRWANEGRPVVRNDTPVRAVHPYDRTWGTLLTDSLHAYVPPEPSSIPDR